MPQGPAFQAEIFGNSDLDMVDIVPGPERFEEDIPEPQHHQILYRLLAEIMVDPEYLPLRENRAHPIIDRPGRFKIRSDRLLQHHARVACREALPAKGVTDVDIKAGRRGQVKDAGPVTIHRQLGFQLRPVCLGAGGVNRDIMDQFLELFPFLVVPIFTGRFLAGFPRH